MAKRQVYKSKSQIARVIIAMTIIRFPDNTSYFSSDKYLSHCFERFFH